jgi:hypothetical protein
VGLDKIGAETGATCRYCGQRLRPGDYVAADNVDGIGRPCHTVCPEKAPPPSVVKREQRVKAAKAGRLPF